MLLKPPPGLLAGFFKENFGAYRLVKLSGQADGRAGGRPALLTICVKVSFSSNNFFISHTHPHYCLSQDLFTL